MPELPTLPSLCNYGNTRIEQECIPVGCVPSAAGGLPQCMLGYTPPQVWAWRPPWVWAWRSPPDMGLETGLGVGLETPWVWAWRPPPGVGLESPPGCGPGDPLLLQGMLGYHLQCMLGYHPLPPLWTE